MGRKLYLIKLGGSVITDTAKLSVSRPAAISRLLSEIKIAKKNDNFDVIIGHGAGSFGHITAKQYRLHEGLVNEESKKGFVITHRAMRELNKEVVETAEEVGLSPHPFTPSSFAHSNNRKIVGGNLEGMKKALERGFTPIVHGDGMFDGEQGISIASTEEVFRFISTQLAPKKIVIGTDIDGVYDKDPALNPNAQLINRIDSGNIEGIVASTGGARKVDVTGGMKTKISLLYEMVKSTNSEGYIANANVPNVIQNILSNNEVRCTRVIT